MSNSPQNQVLVEISGGLADITVTAGEVDYVSIDWDEIDDGTIEIDRLREILENAGLIADATIRDRISNEIASRIDEVVQDEEEAVRLSQENREQRLEAARALLREAGEL